jgi:hypothetical protein
VFMSRYIKSGSFVLAILAVLVLASAAQASSASSVITSCPTTKQITTLQLNGKEASGSVSFASDTFIEAVAAFCFSSSPVLFQLTGHFQPTSTFTPTGGTASQLTNQLYFFEVGSGMAPWGTGATQQLLHDAPVGRELDVKASTTDGATYFKCFMTILFESQ